MPKNLGLYNDDLSTPRKKDVDNCYSPNNVPPYPVTSVNSKSGAVTLSKGDVGLGNVDNVKQYSANNPPPYPVTSVNGKTGAVTLNDVKYVAQTLTDAQKKQARENIGGVEVVISGTQPTNQNIGDIWLKIK